MQALRRLQLRELRGATLEALPLDAKSLSSTLIENMMPPGRSPFLSHAVAGLLVFLSALLQDYATAAAKLEPSEVLAMSATASTTVAKDTRHPQT